MEPGCLPGQGRGQSIVVPADAVMVEGPEPPVPGGIWPVLFVWCVVGGERGYVGWQSYSYPPAEYDRHPFFCPSSSGV